MVGDEERFRTWWPADIHFIGKDITRFHCALWPAMLLAAGLPLPRQVFAHGWVYIKNEQTGAVEKISKSLGNVVEPMEIITKFSSEAFRYYSCASVHFLAMVNLAGRVLRKSIMRIS
jgi:methionyl-tRNA synthetase